MCTQRFPNHRDLISVDTSTCRKECVCISFPFPEWTGYSNNTYNEVCLLSWIRRIVFHMYNCINIGSTINFIEFCSFWNDISDFMWRSSGNYYQHIFGFCAVPALLSFHGGSCCLCIYSSFLQFKSETIEITFYIVWWRPSYFGGNTNIHGRIIFVPRTLLHHTTLQVSFFFSD